MNKRFYKLLIALLLVFSISIKVNAANTEYTNEQTNYKLIIEDDANLITGDVEGLKEDMIPLTEYGNIAFKSINENSTSTRNYASSYYHSKFGADSGTLFLIDMDNREIYIFSDGNNHRTITNGKANIITDNIYRYASREEYYECAKRAFNQIYTLLEGGKIAEPMRYISNILISITTAFLISFIFVLINTKIKKASAREILKNCNISFKVDNITGIKTGTHRVYSPVSDSSSSSGGGGGGGGGGGSSGGGGGHSF